jgi:hypothetical protein
MQGYFPGQYAIITGSYLSECFTALNGISLVLLQDSLNMHYRKRRLEPPVSRPVLYLWQQKRTHIHQHTTRLL